MHGALDIAFVGLSLSPAGRFSRVQVARDRTPLAGRPAWPGTRTGCRLQCRFLQFPACPARRQGLESRALGEPGAAPVCRGKYFLFAAHW